MHYYPVNITKSDRNPKNEKREYSSSAIISGKRIPKNTKKQDSETTKETEELNSLYPNPSTDILPENELFEELLGEDILLVMNATQLNILGQTFRPIFTGTVVEVTNGFITLDPAIIKMNTAPFFQFPTPLSFPLENIVYFTEFDLGTRIPLH